MTIRMTFKWYSMCPLRQSERLELIARNCAYCKFDTH